MKNLSGVFPPITTPFNSDGDVLYDRFRENVDRWLRTGLTGLTVLGSNGESPYLSEDEKLRLLREARAGIPEDRTMIVGTGRESTRLCLDFTRKAADLGADYALVGTPCYFKLSMNDDTLFAHFWTIADESPVPVLIYNVPQFTGVSTSTALIEKLSAHENIVGMKESSGNLTLQAEIRRRTPDRFHILVGSAPTLLPSMIQGACGGIVAIANALPDLTADLCETFKRGDWQKAAEIQARLTPPSVAVTTQYGIPGLKAAMDLTGYYGGYPRLPLLPLKEEMRSHLATLFQAAGIHEAAARS